jgi:hypothetical protein
MLLNNKVETLNTLKVQSPVFFNLCDDVNSIRYFYSDIIGLKENAYKRNSYVDFKSKGKTMMFYQADKIFKKLKTFKDNYKNDRTDSISWTIEVEEEVFATTVQRLLDANIVILNDEPEWKTDGYWSFTVLDPAGNRVEIFMEPKKAPVSTVWSGNLSSNKKIVRFFYQAILKKLAI